MAAFTGQVGAAGQLKSKPLPEAAEAVRHAQGIMLDELPGFAFAIITLAWVVSSFAQLL